MRQRRDSIAKIIGTSWDVCVIGGGATGAGCALDAQLRGLKTVLIEAGDFGSGASGASTKLIHGGLRYLQQAVRQFDLKQYHVVRTALRERRYMLQNAPHLTRVLEFIVPCFTFSELLYYSAGLRLYDWLAGKAVLSRSRFVRRLETLGEAPVFEPALFGAVLYSDGQFDDARYNLALVQSAAESGAEVLNYARVVEFARDKQGHLAAAAVEDREANERFPVRAKVFVNATGPFADGLRRMASPGIEPRLRPSRGVHILLPLPQDFGDRAVLIPETEDERIIFAIPWQGRLLVGTTESDSSPEDDGIVTGTEAEYLLRHLNRYLAKPFHQSEIVSAMSGLRPLIMSGRTTETSRMARDYEIETEQRSGLISVLGGKWTIYRAMAEDAVNAVQQSLGRAVGESPTRTHRLFGFEDESARAARRVAERYFISPETAAHLVGKFGCSAERVLELTRDEPHLISRLAAVAPHIQAEVVYAVRNEMARSIEDVLSRRLGLQLFDWRSALEAAAVTGNILARELGWTRSRKEEEIRAYTDRIRQSCHALNPGSFTWEAHIR